MVVLIAGTSLVETQTIEKDQKIINKKEKKEEKLRFIFGWYPNS